MQQQPQEKMTFGKKVGLVAGFLGACGWGARVPLTKPGTMGYRQVVSVAPLWGIGIPFLLALFVRSETLMAWAGVLLAAQLLHMACTRKGETHSHAIGKSWFGPKGHGLAGVLGYFAAIMFAEQDKAAAVYFALAATGNWATLSFAQARKDYSDMDVMDGLIEQQSRAARTNWRP